MSIPNPAPPGGAWFTIDETPQRNQLGWSHSQVEMYNAGWGDALRAVEAGSIGVGGQQCMSSSVPNRTVRLMSRSPTTIVS
jgi:hypothetical protein